MTPQDRAGNRRNERARDIGLFRYALIREAADPAVSSRARGVMVRQLAAVEHAGPFGDPVRVSRVTIDRWIHARRTGGFDALVPSARYAEARTPGAVLDLAAALKREVPAKVMTATRPAHDTRFGSSITAAALWQDRIYRVSFYLVRWSPRETPSSQVRRTFVHHDPLKVPHSPVDSG